MLGCARGCSNTQHKKFKSNSNTAKEIPAGSSGMIQRELCRRVSGLGWDAGGTKKEFLSASQQGRGELHSFPKEQNLPPVSFYLGAAGDVEGAAREDLQGYQCSLAPAPLGRIQELGRTERRVTDWKGARGGKNSQC